MIKHPSLAQQERTRPKPYLHRFLDVFITLTLWVIGNFKMALKWNFRSLCLAVPDISKNHHHLYALSPKPLKNLVCPTVLSRNLCLTQVSCCSSVTMLPLSLSFLLLYNMNFCFQTFWRFVLSPLNSLKCLHVQWAATLSHEPPWLRLLKKWSWNTCMN